MIVSFFRLLLLCVITVACGSSVMAQRGGTSGELDLLRRDDIRQQLGLSELQVEKITDIQKNSTPGTEFFAPYLERMKGKPPEEAAKIREELNAAVATERLKFQAKAADVLTDVQRKSLRSIFISQAGARALSDPRIADELGLTDEQKASLAKLTEERRDASRNVSFGSSDDAREKFEQEWTGKFLAVLTPEQKKTWDSQAAPVAVAAGPSGTQAAMQAPGSSSASGASTPGAAVPSDQPPEGVAAVSSFGSDVEASDGTKIVEKFSFNFQYAPWEQVLKDFATAAGYTLDLNVVPTGTFSHLDSNSYTASETLDIMNGYLLRKGFALLRNDGFLVCLDASKGGIPATLIPDVSIEELANVGDHEIVRIELTVENVDVAVMAQEVETLLGPLGKMSAFTQTGTLIIADSGDNLRRINNFITKSVSRKKPDDLVFKSYPITNLASEEAEFMLLAQFGMRQGAVNVSASNDSRGGSSRSSSPSSNTTAPQLQVMADLRTNSLFVTGTVKQHELVVEILKAIDVEETPGMAQYRNSGPYLRVYSVSGVDAREITKSLDSMMPGVVINEDGRAGRIHIWATAKQHEQVEEWIRMFDGGGGSGTVAVIPLMKMDPLSAAATLRSLFLSEGSGAPTIETDLYSRVLIIRGSAEQVTQIKTVLAQLGEDGSGRRTAGEGGPIRRYNLMGRSPDEFLDFLQQSWKSSEPNTIRVVVPRQQGPIKELKTPSGTLPGSQASPGNNQRRSNEDSTTMARPQGFGQRDASNYLTASVLQDEQSAVTAVADPQTTGDQLTTGDRQTTGDPQITGEQAIPGKGEEIRILVNGDELILMSNDEEALDKMEGMMDMLQQTLPYRTTWTVFYLQASDATETAAMLEQLFPNTTVSNTSSTGGFSMGNMFSPITDTVSSLTGLSGLGASPQSLRIIPDVRSNSLFVTGPEMVIQEMEQVLRVLDSNEIPESLRDMQPRTIEVKYADIDDVTKIVNDVFKTYTEPPAAARQQQNNPFAALMGGGGKGGDAASQVRMTVGVERQTSTLIISSSESIFTQVQAVVQDLDQSALRANRSIRVVPLKNADASLVQQTLSSLFPRISASSTSSSSSGGNSAPSSPAPESSSSNRGSSQQDAFQQMMQDRMRQQMGGGGRSSTGGFQGGDRGGFPGFGGRGGR